MTGGGVATLPCPSLLGLPIGGTTVFAAIFAMSLADAHLLVGDERDSARGIGLLWRRWPRARRGVS